MRILIVTPKALPDISGNAIDVDRIRKGLDRLGHSVEVTTPARAMESRKADVVHIFHAYKSRIGKTIAERWGVALIVTMTGTDFNHSLDREDERQETLDAIDAAEVVTFLSKANERVVLGRLPGIPATTIVQGPPDLVMGDFDFRRAIRVRETDFLFVMIGGIRPVKNTIFPIPPLLEIWKKNPHVRYVMVGPIIDEKMGRRIQGICKDHPFCIYAGEFAHDKMRGILAASDVIINASHTEGRSNVIFEALSMGKLVLASDIDANAAMITDDKTGLLFSSDDADAFIHKATIAMDPEVRSRIGKEGLSWYGHTANLKEAEEYVETYRVGMRKKGTLEAVSLNMRK